MAVSQPPEGHGVLHPGQIAVVLKVLMRSPRGTVRRDGADADGATRHVPPLVVTANCFARLSLPQAAA
jgi:hypothetical protein